MCRLSWNLGASTSWNPQGLSRPVTGLLYLYLLCGTCLMSPFWYLKLWCDSEILGGNLCASNVGHHGRKASQFLMPFTHSATAESHYMTIAYPLPESIRSSVVEISTLFNDIVVKNHEGTVRTNRLKLCATTRWVRSAHRGSPLVWNLRSSALFFTWNWTLGIQSTALWLYWLNIHGIWLKFTAGLEAEWWQCGHCGLFRRVLSRSLVKRWITDRAQHVQGLVLFSSSPRWYTVTVLPVFYLFFEVPLTRNYQYAKRMLFFLAHYTCFKSKWTVLYSLFFCLPDSQGQIKTGNVASAQNGCARTTPTIQFKWQATTARNNQSKISLKFLF